MKLWLTLPEIAEAALPGLPASASGMSQYAAVRNWSRRTGLYRARQGKGGGLEFSIDLLPEEARAALLRKHAATPSLAQAEPAMPDDDLSSEERQRRDARLHVLALFDQFLAANTMPVRAGLKLFPDAFNAGLVEAPRWVREQVPGVSKNTLQRWQSLRKTGGDDALGLERRGRPLSLNAVPAGAAEARLIAAIAKQPFLSAPQLVAYLRDQFGEQLKVSIPTIRRIRAQIETRDRNLLMAIRDPDGYRSKIEFSATGSTVAAGLNHIWQIDASPADVMLRGKRRHSIYVALDIWSRRKKILVTQTPRASAVAMLLRKCILDWGVPQIVKTDNGSDFVAKVTQRLLSDLGVTHEVSPPYDPKSKGNVERAIGTFQRGLATCPGFIGHSVADRKIIENRKAFSKRLGMKEEEVFDVEMDLPEFQAWCDTWCDTIYAHNEHGGLRGKTPFLRAASWTGEVRKLSHPQALDVLLAPIAGKDGIRKVTKQGIKILHEYYQTAAAWPGDEVLVRMDPADLGRALVFALDGERYLGEAICAPLAGLDPVEVTMKVQAAQKAFMAEQTTELRKEMRKIGPRDFSDALRREGERKAANLIRLDRPATPFSTPALDAAKAALDGGVMPVRDYSAEETARVSAPVIQIPKRQAPQRPSANASQIELFQRAVDLEEVLAAGGTISAEDERWLTGYRTHSDYKAGMRIYRTRGRTMFG